MILEVVEFASAESQFTKPLSDNLAYSIYFSIRASGFSNARANFNVNLKINLSYPTLSLKSVLFGGFLSRLSPLPETTRSSINRACKNKFEMGFATVPLTSLTAPL